MLVSDLAGWWRERFPEVPRESFFTVVPDWICEVLSPRTALRDRGPKLEIYTEHGVKRAWLIDPEARMLEVYRLEGAKWLRLGAHSGDEAVRAGPFDAVPLEFANLWEGLPPVEEGDLGGRPR